MNKAFLDLLLQTLVRLRSSYSVADLHRGSGQIMAAYELGAISAAQQDRLYRLLYNAFDFADKPFPSDKNAGPCISWYEAHKRSLVKPSAQVPASENPEPVPAPASCRELRLLCLLVPRGPYGARTLPVHTMRAMPPRVCVSGRWGLLGPTGFVLRETHARQPSAKVLVRCLRQRQANPFRADSRAVRAGGVMHG